MCEFNTCVFNCIILGMYLLIYSHSVFAQNLSSGLLGTLSNNVLKLTYKLLTCHYFYTLFMPDHWHKYPLLLTLRTDVLPYQLLSSPHQFSSCFIINKLLIYSLRDSEWYIKSSHYMINFLAQQCYSHKYLKEWSQHMLIIIFELYRNFRQNSPSLK